MQSNCYQENNDRLQENSENYFAINKSRLSLCQPQILLGQNE